MILSAPVSLSTELTVAETNVVSLLLAGRTLDEIATERRVSRATVAKQVRSACDKVGVASRNELLAAVLLPGSLQEPLSG